MRLFVLALLLASCLVMALPMAGSAQQYEYVEYTVQKGDTLWDIARSHLEDAFQWPLVWKENLRINNPDLIYPGQVIMVPVRVIPQNVTELGPIVEEGKGSVEAQPPAEEGMAEEGTEEEEGTGAVPEGAVTELKPAEAEVIMSRELLLESGYITRKVPNEGKISGSPIGRDLFGAYDSIYIDSSKPAKKGDKFYVIENVAEVEHPVTGRDLGYMVRVLGVVRVDEPGTKQLKATVLEAFSSVATGDILDTYYDVFPPFVAGEPRNPDVKSVVVASRYMKDISGSFEIVFIDKGYDDDLREGDVLLTLMAGTDDTRNGLIQLVNLRKKTALALILRSRKEVSIGDKVVGVASIDDP